MATTLNYPPCKETHDVLSYPINTLCHKFIATTKQTKTIALDEDVADLIANLFNSKTNIFSSPEELLTLLQDDQPAQLLSLAIELFFIPEITTTLIFKLSPIGKLEGLLITNNEFKQGNFQNYIDMAAYIVYSLGVILKIPCGQIIVSQEITLFGFAYGYGVTHKYKIPKVSAWH